MSNLRTLDMQIIDALFQPPDNPGYVLDFSDRTFRNFFAEELNVDIDDPVYRRNGTSKLKRLKCYLQIVSDEAAIAALRALWNYRVIKRERDGKAEHANNAEAQLHRLLERIGGKVGESGGPNPKPAFGRAKFKELHKALMEVAIMEPVPRGYAFEKFLTRLFNSFGMEARQGFRIIGEQIDGSFVLNNNVYLVEAKWQSGKTAAADLHGFQGKIGQKAMWTRGVFISHAGFTEEGLIAFGRAKNIICIDGLDLSDAFLRELPFDLVVEKKVRRASETGKVFSMVRELFD
jgi:restriction endonuclease